MAWEVGDNVDALCNLVRLSVTFTHTELSGLDGFLLLVTS